MSPTEGTKHFYSAFTDVAGNPILASSFWTSDMTANIASVLLAYVVWSLVIHVTTAVINEVLLYSFPVISYKLCSVRAPYTETLVERAQKILFRIHFAAAFVLYWPGGLYLQRHLWECFYGVSAHFIAIELGVMWLLVIVDVYLRSAHWLMAKFGWMPAPIPGPQARSCKNPQHNSEEPGDMTEHLSFQTDTTGRSPPSQHPDKMSRDQYKRWILSLAAKQTIAKSDEELRLEEQLLPSVLPQSNQRASLATAGVSSGLLGSLNGSIARHTPWLRARVLRGSLGPSAASIATPDHPESTADVSSVRDNTSVDSASVAGSGVDFYTGPTDSPSVFSAECLQVDI